MKARLAHITQRAKTLVRWGKKNTSLKGRLLLAAALWLSAMILAAGVIIPTLIHQYLVDDAKIQLTHALDELSANIEVDDSGNLILDGRLSDPRFQRPYSGLYWSVMTEEQSLRSRSLWDKQIDVKDKGRHANGPNKEKLITVYRTLYLPELNEPVFAIVGVDEDPVEEALQSIIGQLWIILTLLFIGVLILIGAQVTWSLKPLSNMQKELVDLRNGEADSLNANYPKEIAPVIHDLNALLFHYQELLDRARNHAGNLSHALKTPLSVAKNDIRQLPEEYQSQLLIPIEQIQGHIDYHLGRARMAGARNILSVKSNPSDHVDFISIAFDKVFAEREILLINEIEPELNVAVEEVDLDEMIGNLMENAYKWARSTIRVHSEVIEDTVKISIEDNGPGIPEEDRKQALKRGVRLDETTPGTGLGLNIVNEMAHSYRGGLTLNESSMGGLKATLTLKLAT